MCNDQYVYYMFITVNALRELPTPWCIKTCHHIFVHQSATVLSSCVSNNRLRQSVLWQASIKTLGTKIAAEKNDSNDTGLRYLVFK